jgi:hypothetical protein
LLPALEKAPAKFAAFEARRRAGLTALAIERYRQAHQGALPAKLDDLKPQFLASIPIDPFDGQPLRYRPLAKGYVVYSVGYDRQDDGGRERVAKAYGRANAYDETFIVER